MSELLLLLNIVCTNLGTEASCRGPHCCGCTQGGDDDAEVLDAEALQQLLGATSSSSTAASKYKAKAAAIARLGGAAAPAKKAVAATGRGKKR